MAQSNAKINDRGTTQRRSRQKISMRSGGWLETGKTGISRFGQGVSNKQCKHLFLFILHYIHPLQQVQAEKYVRSFVFGVAYSRKAEAQL